MTWDELITEVENAIQQYQQYRQYEEQLYDQMRDAESDANRYNAKASSAEDPLESQEASAKAQEAAQRYFYYENQLGQVQEARENVKNYLLNRYSTLEEISVTEQKTLFEFDQSISVFEEMASNPFGSSASTQLGQLRMYRSQHQEALNMADNLKEKIESAINDDGNPPEKILKR